MKRFISACPSNCKNCDLDSQGVSSYCWDQQCSEGFGLLPTAGTVGGTCVCKLIFISNLHSESSKCHFM